MGSGVTGNTADSGSVIQGSIPCSPARPPGRRRAKRQPLRSAPPVDPWIPRARRSQRPVDPSRTVRPGAQPLSSAVEQFTVGRGHTPVGPVRMIRGTAIVTHRNSARSSSGLGHHPLKVAARVRIPYGLPRTPGQPSSGAFAPFRVSWPVASACVSRWLIASSPCRPAASSASASSGRARVLSGDARAR